MDLSSIMPSTSLAPYVMLFVVLDPIGTIPYYQAIVGRLPEPDRPLVLRNAMLFAYATLIVFAVIGDTLFNYFHITVADFKIAAGIILGIYAVAAIFEIRIGATEGEPSKVAMFPLATPLIAGPGAISAVIYIKYAYGLPTAIASATLNILIAYPILASANLLMRVLGSHGALFVEKFMSLIMAGFAVSLVREGVVETLESVRGNPALPS